ncbi:MAG: patatin-like phospholipase family protein [candidate division NC10 bacterium]
MSEQASKNSLRTEDLKVGLALSGGGFRASLFHIGVLARMAEFGLLRHVEVISTVSGGSIIGALYYVHLKCLLEEKEDSQVTDTDYLSLVQELERDFLAAVQKNIRMRIFRNPFKNLKMALPHYSRSDRIGELYDALLYRPLLGPGRDTPVQMRELFVRPKGERSDFHPRNHNQGRRAKVPILIINATTLNTGHNWRFEASRMGEPPRGSAISQEVDKNMRLRRPPTYANITPRQQDIELGVAVAASACVPAIFHPLAISGLYDQGIRVQLVDGGVHDNQGIQGLLDESCTHFVVSDASGQIGDDMDPATGIFPVLGRSNGILMDRVREEQLFALFGGDGRHLAFMHLRKGLSAQGIAWIDENGQPAARPKAERIPTMPSNQFGVDPGVQDLLSKVRTDLDSFTDIEACSLMLDGYLMSEPELRSAFSLTSPTEPTQWTFLNVRKWMATPTRRYLTHLEVAHEGLFKVFRLSWPTTLLTVLGVGLIGWGGWIWQGDRILEWWNSTISVRRIVGAAVVLGVGFIPWASRTFKLLRFLRSPSELLTRLVLRGLVPAIGSVFVWIHLAIFDPLFLSLGRIQRLK